MRTSRILKKSLTWALTLGLFSPLPLNGPAISKAWAEDAAPLQGSVIKTDKRPGLPTVNENDIKEITPGTTLDMVISTSVSTGVNVS